MALRHQLAMLRRKVPGRVQPTNGDRWFGHVVVCLRAGAGSKAWRCRTLQKRIARVMMA